MVSTLRKAACLLAATRWAAPCWQQPDGQQQTHEVSSEQRQDQDDNAVAAASDGSGAVMPLRNGEVGSLCGGELINPTACPVCVVAGLLRGRSCKALVLQPVHAQSWACNSCRTATLLAGQGGGAVGGSLEGTYNWRTAASFERCRCVAPGGQLAEPRTCCGNSERGEPAAPALNPADEGVVAAADLRVVTMVTCSSGWYGRHAAV
jgi:hypothetical protein